MKQTFASIAIIGLFMIMSISDFDIGTFPDAPANWDASQDPCSIFEIPDYLSGGSDSDCAKIANLMMLTMQTEGTDCIIVINNGSGAIQTKADVEYLVALNGAPEWRNLEQLPCEDCPFIDLAECPQCVKIFEERMED
jgi:hypothetical protein